MNGDVAYNTEHGPVVLRVVPCTGPLSRTKGYLIMPEGIEVGAFLNHQIGKLAPNKELSINEHLDGVPNSYRIWSMYHVKPGESEQFETVHRAVIDVIDGRVHAHSTT